MVAVLHFTSLDSLASLHPHPPRFFRFGFFVKTHLLESSKLKLSEYILFCYVFFLSETHLPSTPPPPPSVKKDRIQNTDHLHYVEHEINQHFRMCEFTLLFTFPPLHFRPLTPHKKNLQIWILCQNSLTRELTKRGFVLSKLITYFKC